MRRLASKVIVNANMISMRTGFLNSSSFLSSTLVYDALPRSGSSCVGRCRRQYRGVHFSGSYCSARRARTRSGGRWR